MNSSEDEEELVKELQSLEAERKNKGKSKSQPKKQATKKTKTSEVNCIKNKVTSLMKNQLRSEIEIQSSDLPENAIETTKLDESKNYKRSNRLIIDELGLAIQEADSAILQLISLQEKYSTFSRVTDELNSL